MKPKIYLNDVLIEELICKFVPFDNIISIKSCKVHTGGDVNVRRHKTMKNLFAVSWHHILAPQRKSKKSSSSEWKIMMKIVGFISVAPNKLSDDKLYKYLVNTVPQILFDKVVKQFIFPICKHSSIRNIKISTLIPPRQIIKRGK
jgi:hypothetical protein